MGLVRGSENPRKVVASQNGKPISVKAYFDKNEKNTKMLNNRNIKIHISEMENHNQPAE